MDILYFFESIRNPVLNAIVMALTELGSEVGFLAIALICFWCVDKRRGYYIMSVGFLGVIINQVMKILFMIPRPWVLDPEFKPVEGSVEGAGGYSFPSGHTQNSTGTFGALLVSTKKNWLKILSAAVIITSEFILFLTYQYRFSSAPFVFLRFILYLNTRKKIRILCISCSEYSSLCQ